MPFLLLFTALAITGVMILAIGKNPFKAYRALFQGAFGSTSAWINTLNKSVPICLSAFAVSMSQKGGTFNIGVEGQLLMGAFACTIAGIYLQGLPAPAHITICILTGMLAGVFFSLIPAILYIKRGVSLLVVFLLMNSIAVFLLQFFVLDLFASGNALVPSTHSIQDSARLPYLILRPNKLSIAILIVLACAFILYFFYNKSIAGYEMQVTGLNERAAFNSGIAVKKYMFLSLVIGGALAGLGGGLEVLGNHHRLYTDFSPGYGYDGIPIALLSAGNPFAAIIGSILFGALRAGSVNMRAMSGVSDDIVSVIQGLLILFVASQYIFRFLLNKRKPAKEDFKG
jgi:simple sugar transport system permease protein